MPEIKIANAPDSIVYNDFSGSVLEWIQHQYIGGKSNITIGKILGDNDVKEYIKNIIRFFSILFVPHLLMYSMTLSSLFILHFFIYMLRVSYGVKHIFCGINRLYKQKGVFQAAMFVPTSLLGLFAVDLGYVVEIVRSFGKEVNNSPAPVSSVIKSKQSAAYVS